MKGFLSSVRIVAFKEFEDCWRNLWLIVGSALFAFLSLAVVFGTAAIGGGFFFFSLGGGGGSGFSRIRWKP